MKADQKSAWVTGKGAGSVLEEHNFVLTCGNLVQIFTPDRWHEIPKEVERLLSWGHKPDRIEISLLSADDPFG